ncbi:MAG: DUF3488 domain-containing protein [Deltaproteobacteria bacterium]|nr:DUF3488 domain-containing protein [Deltaproteobacteria bacterium]
MTIGALHRRALTATAGLAVLGVVGGSATLAIAGGAVLLAMLLSARRLERVDRTSFELWVVHGTTIAGVIVAAVIFESARVDSVFLVLMLGLFNRFLLRAGHRDDFLVIGVSVVLMAGATTVTPGVEFALVVLGFVPALIWALLSSMLLGSAERVGRATLDASRSKPVPKGLATRMAVLGLTLGLGGSLAVAALPRYKFSAFFAPGAYASLSGAASTMQPDVGGVRNQPGDDTVVARVEPLDGRPLGPEGLYLRLYSLDRFDGQVWSASPGGHFRLDTLPRPSPNQRDVRVARVTLDRVVRDQEHHPVAAIGLDQPAALIQPDLSEGLDSRAAFGVHESQAGGWVIDRMRVRSLVYELALGQPAPPAHRTEQFLEKARAAESFVPSDLDPRVFELGKQLTETAVSDEAKVRAVLMHLSRGFSYSLEPLEGTAMDPLARFLFESKRGHCELYANAVAVLLRIGGVRARVATGLYQGTWNSLAGHQSFSTRDAHAWVEAYVNGTWRWYDATPPDLRHLERTGALAKIRDLYDAISAAWFDNIVDFDAVRQRKVYEELTARFGPALLAFVPTIDAGSEATEGKAPSSGPRLLWLLIPALGAIAFGIHERRSRIEALGERLRRVLAGTIAPYETLGALIDRVPAHHRERARLVVSSYERLRFGGAGTPAETARMIRALERALSSEPNP